MNLPEYFSLVESETEGVIASGPFVIEATIEGDRFVDLGFDMTRADASGVSWSGFDRVHLVVPQTDPVLQGDRIHIVDADGDTFVIRPLAFGDGAIVGYEDPSVPSNEEEMRQAVEFLAEYLYLGYTGRLSSDYAVSEDNLYVTRDAEGEPIALLKMSSSHPTLLRQDGSWRQLKPDEDTLLGESDSPAREDAVTAWDSGNIQDLERLLLDDRFSPSEVTNVWLEVNDTDELERLLIERSRGRFYERTREGKWTPAQPNDEAATLDVIWGAISAWDAGELNRVAQAGEYDVNGEAA